MKTLLIFNVTMIFYSIKLNYNNISRLAIHEILL